MSDTLDGSLQRNLLALLCCDKSYGAQVGMQVLPEHFDSGVRREIAKEVFKYRKKYKGEPPGKNLLILVEHLPLQSEQLDAAREEAREILRTYKKGFNFELIATKGIQFARRQIFKGCIREAANLITKETTPVEEIEQLLHRALRNQPTKLETGFLLNDPEALNFFDKLDEGYLTAITPLDRVGVRLVPKTMILYMAPKNTGKSWSCIHIGRACALQGARVLHISLEMSREQVAKRYFQSWFSIASQQIEIKQAKFVTEHGRAIAYRARPFEAKWTYQDGNIRQRLSSVIRKRSRGLNRIKVVDFPTGSLTITQLENYLDALASHENFYPDVLIIDYPDLMRVDRRNFRLELGEIYIALRGLAIERNLALWVPTQVNRLGIQKSSVESAHVSEDISKLFTADIVLTYSQSETERKNGLGRLKLQYMRDGPVGLEIALVQNYAIGQYVCDAMLMAPEYVTLVTDKKKGDNFSELTEENVKQGKLIP